MFRFNNVAKTVHIEGTTYVIINILSNLSIIDNSHHNAPLLFYFFKQAFETQKPKTYWGKKQPF